MVPVADFSALHAVDRYWLVAEALGAGDGPKEFRLPIREPERLWAEEALRDCPRPWLAFGVGSRWVTKRWPPEHFAALARRAQAAFGGTVVFVGGGDEAALAGRDGRPTRRPLAQPERPDDPAAADGAAGAGRRDGGQRHRAAAPGGGAGPAGRGALYLYEGRPQRAVRPGGAAPSRRASAARAVTSRNARGWSAWPN